MNDTDEIERNQNDGNTNEAHKETIDTVDPGFDSESSLFNNETSESKPESIRRSSIDKHEHEDDFIESDRGKEFDEINKTSVPDLIRKDNNIGKCAPSTLASNCSLSIE